MSSSSSKNTTVACTKCKHDFSFERVPKMASVICPHCNTKIRLTHKPKKPTSPKPPAEDQAHAKAKKLPVPDPALPDGHQPQATTPAEDSNAFPKTKPRRTRKRINFDGLKFDESDITDSGNDQAPEAPFEIKTRRTRKRVNLNNLELDEPGQPEAIQPQTPDRPNRQSANVSPPEVKPPSNTQRTPSDTSSILPAGRRLRGNSPVKAKPAPKTKPNTPPTKPNTPPPQTTSQSPLNKPEDDSLEHTEAAIETKNVGTDQFEREDENSLLPPKFLVADIEANENAVVLPSATGGTQVVSRTEVTVSHGGQTIKLVASSPEELKRIRLIENVVAVVIAAIMLAIAVWVLL